MVYLELSKEMWLGEPQAIVKKMVSRGLGLQKGPKEHGDAIPYSITSQQGCWGLSEL